MTKTDLPYDENWIACSERLPGEQGHDSEDVAVFLNGYCGTSDHEKRQGGAWGFRTGYYDAEKGYWRVGGRAESFVTHWQPLPKPPQTAMADYKPIHTVRLFPEEVAMVLDALRASKGDSGATDEEQELARQIEQATEEDE
jgi:hypothetical protein